MISIYSISLKSNPNNIVYIGKTNGFLKYRLNKHIAKAKNAKQHKFSNWIKKQLKLNNEIIIELVEEVNDSDWEQSEIYWIAQFKAWGFNLKNVDLGGVYSKLNKEQTKLLSNRMKYRVISNELKEKYRNLCKTEFGKERIKKAQEASKHKIIQINILTKEQTYWNSLTEAASQYPETKDSVSAIGKVLKGKRKSYKKCYWIYQ